MCHRRKFKRKYFFFPTNSYKNTIWDKLFLYETSAYFRNFFTVYTQITERYRYVQTMQT